MNTIMKKILISLSVIIVMLLGTFFYIKTNYLFMPYEYDKGDALYEEWYEYKGEIEMAICSQIFKEENNGERCYVTTNKEDIKFILEGLFGLENITRSREEYRELDLPEELGEYFVVEISRVDSRDEEGHREDGRNLYVLFFYENQIYMNGYGGSYYYYEFPPEVKEFIVNYRPN